MEFKPPIQISITSDNTELTFVGLVAKTVPQLYEYKYTKGILKKDTTVKISEDEIKKQLTNYWRII
jgi:hypothetical protein